MASDSVYRIVDVVGVSEKSWEDAGRNAVETAAGSLRDLRVAEVTKMDMRVENGKVTAFRKASRSHSSMSLNLISVDRSSIALSVLLWGVIVADSGQRPRLLRPRRERPRSRRAAERG